MGIKHFLSRKNNNFFNIIAQIKDFQGTVVNRVRRSLSKQLFEIMSRIPFQYKIYEYLSTLSII